MLTRTHDTFHCVCFTRRRLAIGENGSIVAGQYIGNDGFCSLVVHFFLRCIWFKNFVKQINFSLFNWTKRAKTNINIIDFTSNKTWLNANKIGLKPIFDVLVFNPWINTTKSPTKFDKTLFGLNIRRGEQSIKLKRIIKFQKQTTNGFAISMPYCNGRYSIPIHINVKSLQYWFWLKIYFSLVLRYLIHLFNVFFVIDKHEMPELKLSTAMFWFRLFGILWLI